MILLEFKFIFVGLWNTGVAFGAFIFLQTLYVPPMTNLQSVFVTYVVSLPHSYFMQRVFVWNSEAGVRSEFLKFFIVSFMQMVLNLFLIFVATDILEFPALASQILIVGVIVVMTFFIMKSWTFRNSRSASNLD